MATTINIQTVPLSESVMKLGVKPCYFSIPSAALLVLLVYANTSIAFNEFGLQNQLIVVVPLVVAWFGLVGSRLQAAIFASVALGPATLLFGVGFLELPGMALTLRDLFTVIVLGMFLVRPHPLYRNKYTTLIWLLLALCIASVLLTENPGGHFGQLLRLGLSIGLISIVCASRSDTLKESVFYGMLLWPFVAFAHLAGIENFWRFISFNEGAALNPDDSGDVLLGSHAAIVYVLFLLPFFLLRKMPKFFILVAMFWIGVLVVFSFSRSLTIGIGTAMILYFLLITPSKGNKVNLALSVVLGGGLLLGVVSMGFFNFNTDEGSKAYSSYVRIAKILAAWNTFMENPVLGIGYGAAGIDFKRAETTISGTDPNFLDVVTDVKASAEFTPSQILAETGLVGGLASLFLVLFSFKCTILQLRNPEKPLLLKIALLCTIVAFITNFVGSNAFDSLVFWLAVPFILDGIEWKGRLGRDILS
ncbi:MAG: O-antigen ligase family protein [Magnetococcales bacterium]|nr:O-antigen ligase family protein [Magnetococcales bacterium]